MNHIIFRSTVFVFLLFSLSFVVPDVVAHGDEPRLEISVDRIQPGGVVDLRGVDFEREESVTIMLVNAHTAIPMGEIMANVEGVFLQTVVLPVELAEGTYTFLAITDDHNITSPNLTVQGPAILAEGQGEEERWEEEEYLPYAIPTYPPGVIPGAVPGATPVGTSESETPGANLPMVALGGLILLSGVLLFMVRRRRDR